MARAIHGGLVWILPESPSACSVQKCPLQDPKGLYLQAGCAGGVCDLQALGFPALANIPFTQGRILLSSSLKNIILAQVEAPEVISEE